jgi:site-specific DNA-methyltransferase (adenine-specific)
MRLINDDCLNAMASIPSESVDMVLCDLPYGTTACKWDAVIPFERLWAAYRRVCKPRAAIVLTASQPFTSMLVASNTSWFRYGWVWVKQRPSNPQLAKKQPLKRHEDVLVFSQKPGRYFPVGVVEIPENERKIHRPEKNSLGHCARKEYVQTHTRYPSTLIEFPSERGLHPTQKPVALMEYLIRTYTKEHETVLDNTMGSGTTGVACVRTFRKFIGIERDSSYFEIARERIRAEAANLEWLI